MKSKNTISEEEQPVEWEQKQKQSENPTDSVWIQKKEQEEIKKNKKETQWKKRRETETIWLVYFCFSQWYSYSHRNFQFMCTAKVRKFAGDIRGKNELPFTHMRILASTEEIPNALCVLPAIHLAHYCTAGLGLLLPKQDCTRLSKAAQTVFLGFETCWAELHHLILPTTATKESSQETPWL